jgi:hypothetical protein
LDQGGCLPFYLRTPQRNRDELGKTTVRKRDGNTCRNEKNQQTYPALTRQADQAQRKTGPKASERGMRIGSVISCAGRTSRDIRVRRQLPRTHPRYRRFQRFALARVLEGITTSFGNNWQAIDIARGLFDHFFQMRLEIVI